VYLSSLHPSPPAFAEAKLRLRADRLTGRAARMSEAKSEPGGVRSFNALPLCYLSAMPHPDAAPSRSSSKAVAHQRSASSDLPARGRYERAPDWKVGR